MDGTKLIRRFQVNGLSPDFNCQPDIYPPTAQIHYIALGICMNHSHRNKDGYITREEFTKVYKKLLELQE